MPAAPVARGSRIVESAPEAVFVFSAVCRYLGAAMAVGVFDRVDPVGVAWFRIAGGALILVPWRRAWRITWTRRRTVATLGFGVAIASLQVVYYLAIEELPLGTTVAIELLGPITVAVAFDRRPRSLAALVLMATGVILMSDVRWEGSAAGVGWALASATMWAAYIVFAKWVADDGFGLDGLAAAQVVRLVLLAPIAGPDLVAGFGSAGLLIVLLLIGVISTAVPQTLDQIVMRKLSHARFSLLQAILPVTATVVGAVVLRQTLEPPELAGIALVVMALTIRR